MADIEDFDLTSNEMKKLELSPVTIVREYKNITVSLKCSGFRDEQGEVYYKPKDIETIEKIMNMIKLEDIILPEKYYRLCAGRLGGEIVGWTSDEEAAKEFEKEWAGNKAIQISREDFDCETMGF